MLLLAGLDGLTAARNLRSRSCASANSVCLHRDYLLQKGWAIRSDLMTQIHSADLEMIFSRSAFTERSINDAGGNSSRGLSLVALRVKLLEAGPRYSVMRQLL